MNIGKRGGKWERREIKTKTFQNLSETYIFFSIAIEEHRVRK